MKRNSYRWAALCAATLTLLGTALDARTDNDELWPPASSPAAAELDVIEGDILVGNRVTARGIGVRSANDTWKDGIVPYVIDDELPANSRTQILDAIERWNEASGISLKPRAGMDPVAVRDYLKFQSGPGCASWVGRRGGEQAVWVAPTCSTGSMMHEIGHALGLEHEHTRPDRDQYIRILWENIDPDKRHNFDTTEYRSGPLGDYDYASIMHYGPRFFSRNGEPTIEPLFETDSDIGQRNAPSTGDAAAIAQLYGTDLELVTETVIDAGHTDIALYVSNQSARGAHDLEVVLDLGDHRLLGWQPSDWRCSGSDGELSCRLDRLTGDAASRLELRVDAALTEVELNPRLRSVTPDTDPTNNGAALQSATADAEPEVASAFSDAADARPAAGAALWLVWLVAPVLRRHIARVRAQNTTVA